MILPALEKGQVVVCDRFYDSTTAYQGYGRGIDLGFIKRLNREAARNRAPDLTFIFDVDYRTSMSRRKRKPDRLERETKAFFHSVRSGFKELAHRRGTVILDGCLDIDSLFDVIRERSLKLITRKKDSIVR
jgi:dTMP kinase